VPESQIDPNLEHKLLMERDGIFRWIVEGALKWQRDGLKPSRRIQAASQQYRNDCDIFGEFIKERCILDPNAKAKQADVWGLYRVWCESNGLHAGSKKMFTKRLSDRGVSGSVWVEADRAYLGIRVRSDRDPLPN